MSKYLKLLSGDQCYYEQRAGYDKNHFYVCLNPRKMYSSEGFIDVYLQCLDSVKQSLLKNSEDFVIHLSVEEYYTDMRQAFINKFHDPTLLYLGRELKNNGIFMFEYVSNYDPYPEDEGWE